MHHRGGDRRLIGYISLAKERATLIASIRKARGKAHRREINSSSKRSFQMLDRNGFCLSLGDWRKDVMGVAVPMVTAADVVLAIICSGPPGGSEFLEREVGPRLARAANSIARHRA